HLIASGRCSAPSWSGDGQHVAFLQDAGDASGLVIAGTGAGGENLRVLVTRQEGETLEEPRWSPAGTQILFRRGAKGDAEVWRVDARDRQRRKVDVLGRVPPGSTAWAPDGQHFAYVRQGRVSAELMVASPGGRPRRIATLGAAGKAQLTWAPDSRRLL